MELLSLVQATKAALFTKRLLTKIGIRMDDNHINGWWDNIPTIRLVNAEIATLHTKLRHVDIHNHWLREVVAQERIKVDYTSTHARIADGLTKVLTGKAFEVFRD
jgi:hypothetical protein